MQSSYDGKCKGDPQHTWNKGDEVFYDKPTKTICIDSKCFQKLKEQAQAGGTGNSQGVSVKKRTIEEKTAEARSQLDLLWSMALNKAINTYHPEVEMAKASEYESSCFVF